jgi:small subunit ribosomal protein S1
VSNDEEDFASMFAAQEAGQKRGKRPRTGDLVKGKIVSIGKEAVFVDIGGKAEGLLDRAQVTNSEGKITVAIGDTIEARVAADEGGTLQ